MRLGPALLFAAALVPARGLAVDAPHGQYYSQTWTCGTCHVPHRATGGTLTNQPTNLALCNSCHQNQSGFGYPWLTSDHASPGVSGRSHHWDSDASNSTYGASAPATQAMAERLSGGKVICSTCHDQHSGASLNGGTQHISPVTGGAGNTSTGSMSVGAVPAATPPRGYLIQIAVAGAVGTATFRISHDSGLTWYGWSGTAWQAGLATGKKTALSPGAELDQTGVFAIFSSGNYVAGNTWKFYVSYPFLRVPNDTSQMCEDCHVARVQTAAYIETGGDGVKVFSHPVGMALGKSYDRALANVLDANGGTAAGGNKDAIITNDFKFDATNKVRCMTCHYPHNADSNSLTEDER